MRVLIASPLGFLIGISLGAVGGGGSILAVPMLVYAAGLPPKKATTASLVIVGATALLGLPSQLRAHRVKIVAGTVFALTGVVGSIVGTHVNQGIDPNALLLAFSGLMVAAIVAMVRRERQAFHTVELLDEHPAEDDADDGAVVVHARVDMTTALKVVAAGTVVGFLTGLFGVGGGFVIVPALVLALGYGMPIAAGTSLLVIALNSAVALAQRYSGNPVPWNAVVEFLVMAVPGVFVGTWLSRRVDGPTLARWFIGLLVVVAAYTAIRSGLALATG
ncbi:MAG: sulfite exporter TauE/SafE family protein [Acidimicrobiia bacterium]